jgi:hypothetical protein
MSKLEIRSAQEMQFRVYIYFLMWTWFNLPAKEKNGCWSHGYRLPWAAACAWRGATVHSVWYNFFFWNCQTGLVDASCLHMPTCSAVEFGELGGDRNFDVDIKSSVLHRSSHLLPWLPKCLLWVLEWLPYTIVHESWWSLRCVVSVPMNFLGQHVSIL